MFACGVGGGGREIQHVCEVQTIASCSTALTKLTNRIKRGFLIPNGDHLKSYDTQMTQTLQLVCKGNTAHTKMPAGLICVKYLLGCGKL